MVITRPAALIVIVLIIAGMDTAPTSSSPSPTFPFTISDLDEYDKAIQPLLAAAESGDTSILDHIQDRFGGVEYDSNIAQKSLEFGHVEFFENFCLLARMTLISLDTCPEDYFWSFWLNPFQDAVLAKADDDLRFNAARFVLEKLLPRIPERHEVVTRDDCIVLDWPLRLPDHDESIWSLPNFHSIQNDRDGRWCLSTSSRLQDERILRYLVNKFRLRFDLHHLRSHARKFNPRLYQFVVDNLDPDIDINNIPEYCRYISSPNDADFFQLLLFSLDDSEYRHSDSDVIEFLGHYPQFLSKIPAIIRWLQDMKASGSSVLGPCWDSPFRFAHRSLDTNEINIEEVSAMLDFLERIGNQVETIEPGDPIDFSCKVLTARLADSAEAHFLAHGFSVDDCPDDETYSDAEGDWDDETSYNEDCYEYHSDSDADFGNQDGNDEDYSDNDHLNNGTSV